MSNLHPGLKATLDCYDSSSEPFEYFQVATAIQKVFNENTEKAFQEQHSVIGEVIAFWFMEDYQGEGTEWGTYYGPMTVLGDGKGGAIENPSIRQVTPEILAYWEARAKESRHPLLQNRYADLVWDLSKTVTGKGANINLARLIIDSAVEIAKSKLHEHETDLIKRADRALFVALSVNDPKRIESVRDAIIKLEDEVGSDTHPGTWGFSFDLLLDNKKISFANAQVEKILSDMENRLKRISDMSKPGTGEVYAIEMAATRLAQFYRKKNQPEDAQRVLYVYRDMVVEMAKHAGSLVGMAWLQKVHAVFLDFGMRKDADDLEGSLQKVGRRSVGEMKQYSVDIPIPPEEIAKHVDAITSGSLEETLDRIAVNYIPNKTKAANQVRQKAKNAPLTYLVGETFVDEGGRPVAKIGPLHKDLEGNVAHHISQTMGILSSVFLRQTMERVLEKHKPDDEQILKCLYRSPVFSERKSGIIKTGIGAYLKGDCISAIHILVPQIEEAVRNLARLIGAPILKPRKGGGFLLRNLDELLRDDKIPKIFGEDAIFYFRVLFTDQRGWNLRNNALHGLMNDEQFTATVADRVFHAMLVLSLAMRFNHDDA